MPLHSTLSSLLHVRRRPWRRHGCGVLVALAAALVPPALPARSQPGGAPLAEQDPQLEVCTGELADGSGNDTVQALAFTPDGQQLLLGCKGGAVELRSLEGELRFRRQSDPRPVAAVAVSPDGQRLITASGQTVRFWSVGGEPLGQFSTGSPTDQAINALAVSADGRRLLIGEDGAVAGLWTLQGVALSRVVPPGPFNRSDARVVSVAFSPEAAEVVIGHEDGGVRRWSLDGRLLGVIETDYSPLRVVRPLPQGELLAAGWHGAARWDARGEPLQPLRQQGIVDSLQLLPTGRTVVLAGVEVDPYLEVRDLLGSRLLTLQPSGATDGPLAVSPDGGLVVLAEGGRLSRWLLPPVVP